MADELGGFEDVFDAGGGFDDGLEEVGTPLVGTVPDTL